MGNDPLNAQVIARICKHMNDDHENALIAYANKYAGISSAKTAQIIELTAEAMKLKVDEQIVKIAFDHHLVDSSDAHRTLVDMFKGVPST